MKTLLITILTLTCYTSFSQGNLEFSLELGYRYNREKFVKSHYFDDRVSEKSPSVEFAEMIPAGHEVFLECNAKYEEFWFPVAVGVSTWSEKMTGEQRVVHFSSGTIPSIYDTYVVNYDGVSSYIHLSIGVGVNVLDPEFDFYLMPIIRFNPEFLMSRKTKSITVDEYAYDLGVSPDPVHASYSGVTTTSDGKTELLQFDQKDESNYLGNFHPSVAFRFGGRVFDHIGFNLESGIEMQNFSRVVFGEYAQTYFSWYAQASVGYVF